MHAWECGAWVLVHGNRLTVLTGEKHMQPVLSVTTVLVSCPNYGQEPQDIGWRLFSVSVAHICLPRSAMDLQVPAASPCSFAVQPKHRLERGSVTAEIQGCQEFSNIHHGNLHKASIRAPSLARNIDIRVDSCCIDMISSGMISARHQAT